MKAMRLVPSILILALATHFASADVKIKSRMTVMGMNMDSTTYIKGNAQRNDTNTPYGGGQMYSLYQCDKMRMVQVSSAGKAYYVTSLDEGKSSTENNATAGQQKSDGVVQMTAKMTETGEKKKILGFEARHVVIEISTEPGPGACTPKSSMKQDVWFIDLPVFAGCANSPREYAKMRPQESECGDKVNFKLVGAVKPGYPAEMTMTMQGPNGQPMTMKREVVDISTSTLDASLFEIPAGYRQVSSARELMSGGMGRGVAPTGGGASATTSGVPVGGYPPGYRPTTVEEARAYAEYMKQQYAGQIPDTQRRAQQAESGTSQSVNPYAGAANQNAVPPSAANASNNVPTAAVANSNPYMTARQTAAVSATGRMKIGLLVNANGSDADTVIQRMIARFGSMGIDAIPLQDFAGTPWSAQNAVAKDNGCEYLLVTDANVKAGTAAKPKVAGAVNKSSGGAVSTAAFDASMNYKLYRVGDVNARLESASQSNGASTVEDGVRKSVDQEVPAVIAQINKEKSIK
jgi:hypothetical protein